MKAATWFIVLALALSPCAAAKDKRSFWQKMFVAKPKPVKKRHKSHPKPKPSPPKRDTTRNEKGCFIVEPQWMATYWEVVAAWDYQIPDERDITFKDGKYHVPPVVYRHYDDMVNARKRASEGAKGGE